MAQRGVGGARCERLVDVNEVELDGAEQFLDRAGDVDRQRRRAPARAATTSSTSPTAITRGGALVGSLQQGCAGRAARRAQRLARGAHPLLRARRSQDQHAVPAPRELGRDALDVRVDLVVLRLPRVRGHVGDRERGAICSPIIPPADRPAPATAGYACARFDRAFAGRARAAFCADRALVALSRSRCVGPGRRRIAR